jgi:crossover junction endodeoxyribonuclease RuvC
MPEILRVLAVDPALRNTGYAVLEQEAKTIRTVAYGVIQNPAKLLTSGCLVAIREKLSELIQQHRPTECAVESTIYVQSFRTAITLGSVRGAVLIAAAEHGLPIYDYAPREVKQAAVGRGGAGKEQVAFMMRSMLRLRETPPPDAADALAVALTHLQSTSGHLATSQARQRV